EPKVHRSSREIRGSPLAPIRGGSASSTGDSPGAWRPMRSRFAERRSALEKERSQSKLLGCSGAAFPVESPVSAPRPRVAANAGLQENNRRIERRLPVRYHRGIQVIPRRKPDASRPEASL